jgi:outer membrane lipoprotein LolB
VSAHKLLFFNIFFAVICIGCASFAPLPEEPADFQLRGKLGVVEGSESFSARFVWRQQGSGFTIDLWGPLGQGRVRLSGDAHRIAVLDGHGAILVEGDHAQVMHAQLGWTLPLAVLPDWVLGAPGNGSASGQSQYDAAGHLVAFEQLDWAVTYAQHREVEGADGTRWLPRKITASKGDYRVRLVITEWQI